MKEKKEIGEPEIQYITPSWCIDGLTPIEWLTREQIIERFGYMLTEEDIVNLYKNYEGKETSQI